MAADGSVLIEANLSVDKAEKNLEKLKNSIEKTEGEIAKTRKARDEADQEGIFKAAELDREQAKLSEMRQELQKMREIAKGKSLSDAMRAEAKMAIPGMQADIADQATRVRMMQADYNKVAASVERYDRKLASAAEKLNAQKSSAGALIGRINAVSASSRKMAEAQERAAAAADRFKLRLREVIRSALVFTLITQTLAKFREWMGKVVQTNAEATAAFARLKGALLTLAQPLVEVIIPALVTFLNILTRVVSVAAQLVSFLFGKTASQSQEAAKGLNEQTEALEGVGGAAKDAGKSMASFDEINKLSGGSSAGGGASSGTTPDFSMDLSMESEQLQNLLGIIAAIGAGLAAWKLGNGLLNSLKIFAGLMLAIGGAVGFVKGMWDAWQNGIDMQNLSEMLLGMILLATGLGIAFGPVAAGIGLLVSGFLMLVTAFHDAAANGWNVYNVLAAVAGLIGAGLGLSLLTGSWVPMLIGALAAVLLAITTTFGDGEALIAGFQDILTGLKDFVVGIFTGDLTLAFQGLALMFQGLATVFFTVIESVKNMFISFLDWLDEMTGGRLHVIIETAKGLIVSFAETVTNIFAGMIEALQQIFQGIITFLIGTFTGDWNMAFRGLQNIFRGFGNAVISMFESVINFIIDGINWFIDRLNDLASPLGEFGIKINIPNINNIQIDRIPMLAQGAIIPPNREFMAILGDQKSGNNIETPEALLRQIVREEGGGNGNMTFVFEGDLAVLASVFRPYLIREGKRVGVEIVTTSKGVSY